MQTISKNGVTKIKLLQTEERQMRNAAYLARLAGKLIEGERGARLEAACVALLELVDDSTTPANKAKLDAQDAMTPETMVGIGPHRPAAGPILPSERGALK